EHGRGESLLGLGHQELDARALGPDGSAAQKLTHGPVRVMAKNLDSDQRTRQRRLNLRILEHWTAVELAPDNDRHGAIKPRPQLDLAGEGGRSSLVPERVHG